MKRRMKSECVSRFSVVMGQGNQALVLDDNKLSHWSTRHQNTHLLPAAVHCTLTQSTMDTAMMMMMSMTLMG